MTSDVERALRVQGMSRQIREQMAVDGVIDGPVREEPIDVLAAEVRRLDADLAATRTKLSTVSAALQDMMRQASALEEERDAEHIENTRLRGAFVTMARAANERETEVETERDAARWAHAGTLEAFIEMQAERDAARASLEAERIENTHLREAFMVMERAANQREAEAARLREELERQGQQDTHISTLMSENKRLRTENDKLHGELDGQCQHGIAEDEECDECEKAACEYLKMLDKKMSPEDGKR